MNISGLFAKFSRIIAHLSGQSTAFVLAVCTVVAWLVTGPLFGFSDTWQLVINTGTTIITFLMVFLIQNTQNRDSEAVQIKLDELIRSHKEANNSLLDLEELTEEQLDLIKNEYEKLAEYARKTLAKNRQNGSIIDKPLV